MSSDLHPRNMCTTWYVTRDFIPFVQQNTKKFAEHRCGTRNSVYNMTDMYVLHLKSKPGQLTKQRSEVVSWRPGFNSLLRQEFLTVFGLTFGAHISSWSEWWWKEGEGSRGTVFTPAEAQYLHLHLVSKISMQNCYISVCLFNPYPANVENMVSS